jgi:hypothetical protein
VSSKYTLGATDVGHTVGVVVTASNAGGATAASSAVTGAVAKGEAYTCANTLTASQTAAEIEKAIIDAANGSTVCLASGVYPFVDTIGAVHTSFVTVRPAPGASVSVAGMEVRNSSFLRFEGLHMTAGFNMRDSESYAGSHDYQFIDNTFEAPVYGIVLHGGAETAKGGGPIKKVLIEGNYMHHVHLEQQPEEVGGKCVSAGYAGGQDVSIDFAEGVTIARNTFNEAAWHYIQGGGAGPEGVDVEHNLFEGHDLLACSHLNLWQIWGGGENDTFKDNVAIGQGPGESEQAATDGLIFENGAGSGECSVKMTNSVIENNLFIDAANSYELQIYTTAGVTIKNNTVVRSMYGTGLLNSGCGESTKATMTHNIDVENQDKNNADFHFACEGECHFDYNVSGDDESAEEYGATHYVTRWAPQWTTTKWDLTTEPTIPTGFYTPTSLPIEAGYQSHIGP